MQIYAVIKPKKGEFISFLTVIRFGHIYQALGQTGGEDRTVVTWIVNSDLLRSLISLQSVWPQTGGHMGEADCREADAGLQAGPGAPAYFSYLYQEGRSCFLTGFVEIPTWRTQ